MANEINEPDNDMADNQSESEVLICFKAQGYTPVVASVKDRCGECGEWVWRAKSSPPGMTVLCVVCGAERMRKELAEGSDVEVAGPTPEQLRDILRHDTRASE